jgi:TRAP-type uncharacterized transport system substrate-binding protein
MKRVLALLCLMAANVFAQQTPLVLGTATSGGRFPLCGAEFAQVVNAEEGRLRVEPKKTKGSTENVPLLETGRLDLALAAGEVASAALGKPHSALHPGVRQYLREIGLHAG